MLGANGAGKTTTLRAISGTVRRTARSASPGKPLGARGPERSRGSASRTCPEGRGTFAELTVWENLRLGAYTRRGSLKDDFAACSSTSPGSRSAARQQAGTLRGGEQQMLALARAFMQRPRLLLLDEPSLGLAPLLVAEIFRIVRELNEREGTDRARRRAERAHRAAARAARVRARGRPGRARGHERGARRRTSPIRRSYLGY